MCALKKWTRILDTHLTFIQHAADPAENVSCTRTNTHHGDEQTHYKRLHPVSSADTTRIKQVVVLLLVLMVSLLLLWCCDDL